MNKMEISFNATITVSPDDLHYHWRSALDKDEYEAIYPYQIAEFLKEKYSNDINQLFTDMNELTSDEMQVDSSYVYVWEVHDE